jgi:TAP-like protein
VATSVVDRARRIAAACARNAGLPDLTGSLLRAHTFRALYSDSTFPLLAQLMNAARTSAPLPVIPIPAPAQFQNFLAAFTAIGCNDVAWPRSVRQYADAVAWNRRAFPLTAGMPANIFPCAFWPYQQAEPATQITPHGPDNVLMVQNLRDPATPHSAALPMRDAVSVREAGLPLRPVRRRAAG